MVQDNHIWFGNHDPRYYLHPSKAGMEYKPPTIKGYMECKMNNRNRMISPMLQDKKLPLFTITKLHKKYKRQKIIRTKNRDSSNVDPALLERFPIVAYE